MMQNFINYIRLEEEQIQIQEKKEIIVQCYNSLQTYLLLMKEFTFPSLSLMKKITEGQLDAVKCPKSLKSQGMIPEDILLMFDEMYLQKCEEYCGGEIIGANENNELRITRIYDHRIKRKCPLNYQICSRAKH